MKFHIKFAAIEASITRPFNLRAEPAFSFKAENYEVTMDLEQLASGFQDLIKVVLAAHFPAESDKDFFKPSADAVDEILRKAAMKSDVMGKDPDQDVPQ
jgi:hypothetical protein